ncbi:MAG TPA: phosphate acyltransferase, partial [Candidatus Berkiella sp.]|nr:phosphate acyltransferase [Candidatus Berkiella sp.]
AAINITPDLMTKRDIVQNAIDLMRVINPDITPKVGILSAVETITPAIQSTIDAACLCKMAGRGQITGAIVDGPFAYDNVISVQAAKVKKIKSKVIGDVDIYLVPNLEAGNMLAKQLAFLTNAFSAGMILGA